MTALQRILQVAQAFKQYGAIATAAVGQVQTEVGASAGNPALQQTKKQLAVTYVLAAAHAGESVPIPQVALIATVVEMAAQVASALGAFGKVASPAAVSVPVLPAAVASPAVSPVADSTVIPISAPPVVVTVVAPPVA